MARIEALFLLLPPFGRYAESNSACFEALVHFLETDREVPRKDGVHLRVRAEPCPPKLRKKYFANQMRLWCDAPLLRFVGDFLYPGVEGYPIVDGNGALLTDPNEHLVFWKSFLPDRIDAVIQTYICALCLAYPGALRCGANIWLMDGETIEHRRSLVSMVTEAVEFLIENDMRPPMVDPDKAIKWVFSQNGMLDGYSDTPGSRALNYFTRLFVEEFRNDELSDLVWALGGIEALLVSGGRSSLNTYRLSSG